VGEPAGGTQPVQYAQLPVDISRIGFADHRDPAMCRPNFVIDGSVLPELCHRIGYGRVLNLTGEPRPATGPFRPPDGQTVYGA
jgi:hypothetical protein